MYNNKNTFVYRTKIFFFSKIGHKIEHESLMSNRVWV